MLDASLPTTWFPRFSCRHPDKHANGSAAEKAAAEKAFKEIAEAYEALSDPNKKEVYDRFGEAGLKRGGGDGGRSGFGGMGPGGIDPNELFAQFFGGAAGSGVPGGFGGGGVRMHFGGPGGAGGVDLNEVC